MIVTEDVSLGLVWYGLWAFHHFQHLFSDIATIRCIEKGIHGQLEWTEK